MKLVKYVESSSRRRLAGLAVAVVAGAVGGSVYLVQADLGASKMRDGGTEVIEIYGCPPGYIELGSGRTHVCITRPPHESGGGFFGGGGTPRDPGGGRGGPPPPPPPPPKNCNQCNAQLVRCHQDSRAYFDTCKRMAELRAWEQCEEDRVSCRFRPLDPDEYTCHTVSFVTPDHKTKWTDVCEGPAIDKCERDCKYSLPGVSGTDGISITVPLPGGTKIGGSSSLTVTYGSRTGWYEACMLSRQVLDATCDSGWGECATKAKATYGKQCKY